MYKTVLLDIDGTLLDTTQGVIEAVKTTIKETKLPMMNEDILKLFVGPVMQNSFKKYYKMDDKTALETANLFRANYRKYSLYLAEPYSGVMSFLSKIKKAGLQIAVATNKSEDNAVAILDKFNILQYCDCAVGSDLLGKLTKADIINECIKKLQAEKSTTVMVGDSEADSRGAEIAGIDFIAVTYGFGFKSSDDLSGILHKKVFDNISDVGEYIISERIKKEKKSWKD